MSAAAAAEALALTGIVKTFGASRALDGANLIVRSGEIHGLIGQNGAGKSTIIKVLAGLYRPEAGRIAIGGEPLAPVTPRAVEARGVHIIHQEPLLPPGFTVAEALFLGREPHVGPLLARRRMRQEAERIIAEQFGINIPGDLLIADLSAAERQVVQITRALLDQPRVLVFDEPTAALVRQEAHRLFAIIRRLAAQGTAIVYISHYLEEVRDLCDRVTILRNGRDVGTLDPRETPMAEMVARMINRDIDEMFPKRAITQGPPVLELRGFAQAGRFDPVSFTLHEGEILGLTGLLGSGAKEVVQALFGLHAATAGHLLVRGQPVSIASPGQAVARGFGLVPEDRRHQGIAPEISARENATLASLRRLTRFGLIDGRRERQQVQGLIERLGIKTPGTETRLRDLSGGNQQKVVLAKWLSAQSDVYILDEPTVAVDVAAKVEIYKLLGELAARGAAILVLSTDLMELRGLCDRILVMYRGRITRRLLPAETSADEILAAATGAAPGRDDAEAA